MVRAVRKEINWKTPIAAPARRIAGLPGKTGKIPASANSL